MPGRGLFRFSATRQPQRRRRRRLAFADDAARRRRRPPGGRRGSSLFNCPRHGSTLSPWPGKKSTSLSAVRTATGSCGCRARAGSSGPGRDSPSWTWPGTSWTSGMPSWRRTADRPVTLQRFKDTVDGEQFFSKNPPKGAPDFIRSVDVVYPSGRSHPQLVIDEIAAAVWAVQMNTVVFHPWASRAGNPDNPDELRIDLDPQPGTGFAEAVPVALELRRVLAEAGLDAFIKTSGNRGLHVFAPIEPTREFLDVRHAVIAAARELERRLPAAGHHRVVEGRTRRPHLRRFQPGEPRPHDGGGLQPARARERDGVVPAPLGGARGRRSDVPSRSLTVPERLKATGDPWAGMHAAARAPSIASWNGGSGTSRPGWGSCRSRRTFRRCPGNRRGCSRAGPAAAGECDWRPEWRHSQS